MKRFIIVVIVLLFSINTVSCEKIRNKWKFRTYEVGDKIDSLHGVYVYYNTNVGNVSGRNLASDGYNIGLKYQCVEFVKRYYYEHYNHKMPDSYGHAKDFFTPGLADGALSVRRNLYQHTNPSKSKPKVGDLLVYAPTAFNKYGHVAIVSKVSEKQVEIIQQNPGSYAPSRKNFGIKHNGGEWKIDKTNIVGWLRKYDE